MAVKLVIAMQAIMISASCHISGRLSKVPPMTVAKVQIRKHQIALGCSGVKEEIVFGVNVVGNDGAEGKQNNHEGNKLSTPGTH